ncbi:hypothetical protein Droror1_Dr00000642 [Drosera rotundifolia]
MILFSCHIWKRWHAPRTGGGSSQLTQEVHFASCSLNCRNGSPKEGLLGNVTAHGDISQILFDISVPKDIEGSAIILLRRLEALPLPPAKRQVIFNPIRSIPRTRL